MPRVFGKNHAMEEMLYGEHLTRFQRFIRRIGFNRRKNSNQRSDGGSTETPKRRNQQSSLATQQEGNAN